MMTMNHDKQWFYSLRVLADKSNYPYSCIAIFFMMDHDEQKRQHTFCFEYRALVNLVVLSMLTHSTFKDKLNIIAEQQTSLSTHLQKMKT